MRTFGFQSAYLCLLLWVSSAHAGVEDFAEFLETQTFKVLEQETVDFRRGDPLWEYNIVVEDAFHRRFVLYHSGFMAHAASILHAEFAQLMGLDALPIYPTFFTMCSPEFRAWLPLEILKQECMDDVPSALSSAYHPAVLIPYDLYLQKSPAAEKESPLEMAKAAQMTLMAFILGTHTYDRVLQDGRWVETSVVPKTLMIERSDKGILKLLSEELKGALDWKKLKALSAADAEEFAEAMRYFFDSLDVIHPSYMASRIDWMLKVSADAIGRGIQDLVPYKNFFRRSPSLIRQGFQEYLQGRIGGHFAEVDLEKKPQNLRNPHYLKAAPKYNLDDYTKYPDISDASIREGQQKNLLYALHATTPTIRKAVVSFWKRKLNGEDPVALLMRESALWDSTSILYGVMNDLTSDGEIHTRPPQILVAQHAPPITLVVPVFDEESQRVVMAADTLKQRGMDIKVWKFAAERRPVDLGEKRARQIVSFARDRRIIFCEVGGLTPYIRKILDDGGVSYEIIDHHNYARHEWRWRTTLEAVWRRTGFRPSPDERVRAMMDNGGVTRPARALNLDRKQMYNFFKYTTPVDPERDFFFRDHNQDSPESVPRMQMLDGDVGLYRVSKYFAEKVYPESAEFIARYGHRVVYVGPQRLAWQVIDVFAGVGANWGGDMNTNMFVIIPKPEGVSTDSIDHLVESIVRPGQSLAGEVPTAMCERSLRMQLVAP